MRRRNSDCRGVFDVDIVAIVAYELLLMMATARVALATIALRCKQSNSHLEEYYSEDDENYFEKSLHNDTKIVKKSVMTNLSPHLSNIIYHRSAI